MKIRIKKLSRNELLFLLFFLPLYFLKTINITANNKLLQLAAVIGFGVVVLIMFVRKYSTRELCFWMFTGGLLSIITICSGKEGALFSLVMFFALDGLNNKKIYKYSLTIGIIGVAISMYIESHGSYGMRYIGGVWQMVYKRSNILFIAFFSIIALYTIVRQNQLRKIEICFIFLLSYGMYKYSGSRTGLVVVIVYIICLLVLNFKIIRKRKIVELGIYMLPTFCFAVSIFMGKMYGKLNKLYTVDSMLQGRLRLSNVFLNTYTPKLFGQRLFESSDPNNFMILDCAYIDMLLAYGILFSLIWLVLTTKVLKYLYKQDRYVEISLIIAYVVYGIPETFLPNCFLNISLFLYAEYILCKWRYKRPQKAYELKTEENSSF